MSAVLGWVRAEASMRWRGWLGLALLLGIAGGAVTAAAAGARRTDSVYDRFLVAQDAADIVLFDDGEIGVDIDLDAVARLPQVESSARSSLLFYSVGNNGALAAVDDRLGRTMNRLKLLAGRMYDPGKVDEVVVGFGVARRYAQLRLGATFSLIDPKDVEFFKAHATPEELAQFDELLAANITLKVVGIVAGPGEFPPQYVGSTASIHFTPAFFERYGNFGTETPVGPEKGQVFLKLHRGTADIPAFKRAAQELAKAQFEAFITAREMGALTKRSFHFQALGLWLLAGFGAVATLLIVGQALTRHAFLGAGDYPILRALGFGRRQLLFIGMTRASLIGLAGSFVSVAVAVALSPLTPFGDARIAEPHPGFAFDGSALGLGAAGVIIVALLMSAAPAWRAARTAAQSRSEAATVQTTSRAARVAVRTGMSPSTIAGVRMALVAGRGRNAVPVRSTLAGLIVGIAVLVGALTFGSSLDHLLATPGLYGARWDAYVTGYGFGDAPDLRENLGRLDAIPGVSDLAIGSYASIEVGGQQVPFVTGVSVKGNALPPIVDGRFPAAADEVAVGARTMRRMHVGIGDSIAIRIPFEGIEPKTFTVVGRVVIPPSGQAPGGPGEGVLCNLQCHDRMLIGVQNPEIERVSKVQEIFLTYEPGADRTQVLATIAPLVGFLPGDPGFSELPPETPVDIVSFGRVQNLPLMLGLVIGVIAAGTLVHTVVSSVRRRRSELAILKTLGFIRGQIRTTVAWQATVLIAAGLLVGLPAGLIGGRWLWRFFADQLGMVPKSSIPTVQVLILVPVSLALANVIAAIPGRSAARVHPAQVLHTE